jgi:hypothetical protein
MQVSSMFPLSDGLMLLSAREKSLQGVIDIVPGVVGPGVWRRR